MSSISNLNRMAGLMSGLDTEALIKSMTANTKARLDSQKQKLQILQWRQESYRSIISKISDFKDKYLNILSPTSIKAQAIMNKYVASSSNDKLINATAASGATPAKYTIKSASAATSAHFDSNGSVSANAIKLNFSKAVDGKSYGPKVTFDGIERSVRFTADEDPEKTKENFLKAVNDTFSDLMTEGQSFEFSETAEDGSVYLKFAGNDNVTHTISIAANTGIGLTKNADTRITTSSTLGSANFAQELKSPDGKYNININGVEFEFNNNTTIADMIKTINNSNAGVKMSFSNISQSFTIESKDTGVGAELNIYQTNGNLLNSIFNWSGTVGAPVHADKANVTYQDLDNIGTALSSSYSEKLKKGLIDKVEVDFQNPKNPEEPMYALNLDISGNLKAIRELDGDDDEYTAEEIKQAFNNALRESYGDPDLPDIFEYTAGENGAPDTFVIFTDEYHVKMNDSNFNDIDNYQTFKANTGYAIAKKTDYPEDFAGFNFYVEGKGTVTVNFKEGQDYLSIQDFIDAGIFEMPTDGTLMAAKDTVITGADEQTSLFLDSIFGKSEIVGAKDGAIQTAHGTNASITISNNGTDFATYTSSSNLFTFDGTTIDVSNSGTFDAGDNEDDYIIVDVTKDTSGIMDVVKSFVEDYNTLIADLYGETSTSRPKTNNEYYDPLTDDMKEEMSDKEIEKWEEQAKIGWLYNDRNVLTFLSNLRGAMNTYVDGFGLADMGITLTKDWKDNGKLEINESQLEAAINAYGDKVTDFFTKASTGLSAKLEAAVDNAISTNSTGYGYLSALAGIEGTRTNNDNQIYRQMQSIQDIIDRLTEKYEKEQSRYWTRFSALETYMARMQAQMSYFTNDSTSSY